MLTQQKEMSLAWENFVIGNNFVQMENFNILRIFGTINYRFSRFIKVLFFTSLHFWKIIECILIESEKTSKKMGRFCRELEKWAYNRDRSMIMYHCHNEEIVFFFHFLPISFTPIPFTIYVIKYKICRQSALSWLSC